jgi:drug/metabolite transporter (DMT)-like permease
MPSAPPTVTKHGPSALALWANLGIVYVVWGSTYFGIAISIETIPPFMMAAIRFAIAGLILIAWDLLRHPEARRLPTKRQLLDSAIVGGLLLGVGNGFVVFAEKTVPSGIAAILIGMMPLWFALLGWLYLRQKLPRLVVGAIILGFGGVALLIWPFGEGANHYDALGIFVLFLAPLGWAHGSIYSVQRAKLPHSPFTASGLQMLAGAAVTGVESLVINEPAGFDPAAVSTESIVAVAYLILFGSMLAYTSYAWLLRNAPLSLVGTYAYVNPVVAVALGTVFLREPISARTLVASAVILVAVAIIVTARGRLAGVDASDEVGAGNPDDEFEAGSPSAVPAVGASPRPTEATVSPAATPRARSG